MTSAPNVSACCPRSPDVPVDPPNDTRFDISDLGNDNEFDYALMQCTLCRTTFGKLYSGDNGFPRSGRWYMFEVPADCPADKDVLMALCNRAITERQWMYVGGSYWGRAGGWARTELLRQTGWDGI